MTTTLIRRAGVFALIAATTTTLTGCAGVLGARMTYNDTVQAKVTEVALSGRSGDVIITTGAVQQTTIKRVVRGSSNPGESYRMTGSTLNLDTSCGPDCQASYEEMKARGVEFTEEPHPMPYGIDSGFRDPSGNSVRLTQLAEIPANTG